MDEAQKVELEALYHQAGMNVVIDRGDSAVQQFYCGSTVFVTGSSGFLGKGLVEKLFRSCQIKKMYVLLRSKKNKTIQERINLVLADPLYDVLRKKQPDFAEKIVPLEGNVADIRLGLSDDDWMMLTKEVDTVFHLAATIRFDEPLKVAALINVRGTREILALAKECPKLKSFVYVSTAYTHATKERVGKPVLEQFYPCPVTPDAIIALAETLDEKKLEKITKDLIEGWPNTYSFTKAIAEELIRTTPGVHSCVIRPPIVFPSYYEPMPGWLDVGAVSGPPGLIVSIILGVMHVFYVGREDKLPLTPVDYVNNATIAAGWDAARRKSNGVEEIPIYTVSNKNHFITWNFIGTVMRTEGMKLLSPKTIWYYYLVEVNTEFLYWLLAFFLHYIPAFTMDVIGTITGRMPNGITSYVDVYRKIDKFALIVHYFLSNEWGFVDDNVQAMISKMSDADKDIYNCDLNTIDFHEYIKVNMIGVRKYIIKDGLINSQSAYEKQKIFKTAHYFYLFVVGTILYTFLYFFIYACWSFVNTVL